MPYFNREDYRLHYREQGTGSLVIMLPGNTASSAHLERDMKRLSDRYRVVALDPLGTGKSDRLAQWPLDWWERTAHDAAALAKELGHERLIVMGSSGGAISALLMAALYPDRVRAVIADSASTRMQPEALRNLVSKRKPVNSETAEFYRFGHGEDWEKVVEADSDLLLRFAESGGDWATGRLGKIVCPVLFTGSFRDQLIPDLVNKLAEMAAETMGSRLFLVNDGGHPLMWTMPDVFYSLVNIFLAELR